jgi:hypothetical protein
VLDVCSAVNVMDGVDMREMGRCVNSRYCAGSLLACGKCCVQGGDGSVWLDRCQRDLQCGTKVEVMRLPAFFSLVPRGPKYERLMSSTISRDGGSPVYIYIYVGLSQRR